MAKYTINYACGHGSHVEQLYGKNSERERRIEWEEANKVCPACYKEQIREADEKADPKAVIRVMCNAMAVTLRAEVTGQTHRNKDALFALGIRRQEGNSGFMDLFATKARWFCGIEIRVETPEALVDKGMELVDNLEALGYTVSADFNPSHPDTALAFEVFRQRARDADKKAADEVARVEREKADPRPPNSPLRNRITILEKETGSVWNGKLYGKPGSWNFYVSGKKHLATDAEVAERVVNLKLHKAWQERNP